MSNIGIKVNLQALNGAFRNFPIKREQYDACISIAEREESQDCDSRINNELNELNELLNKRYYDTD